MSTETSQRAEWKGRLVSAVIHQTFPPETIAEMLVTGLYEAHICRETGNARLADAIMELDKLNRRDDGQTEER